SRGVVKFCTSRKRERRLRVGRRSRFRLVTPHIPSQLLGGCSPMRGAMMAYRWVAACGIGLLTALHAAAQTVPTSPVAPAGPDCLDQPTQPPLLLKPPSSKPSIPLAEVPRGPVGEYDHGQFYLPDYVPSEAPESCRPLGRWWVSPSLELG